MVSGASSLANITTGRGVCCVITTRCSSTSRLGESVSITITSGCSSSMVFRSASGEESEAVTSYPARRNTSRRMSARSGDSSTTSTRTRVNSQIACQSIPLGNQGSRKRKQHCAGAFGPGDAPKIAAMREPQPKTIHLKDYTPPAFRVDDVDLDVDIRDDHALVRAKLAMRRNAGSGPLVLDGDELQLVSLSIDGQPARHEATPERLTVYDVPERFTLETLSRIVPQKNTKLEGLYATKNGFVTQCEAEGFRRITWFLDRPDVMATYTTTIHADKKRYPVLLSNGNLAGSGDEPNGRHWASFHDPFPKPSYLFAMVAAEL